MNEPKVQTVSQEQREATYRFIEDMPDDLVGPALGLLNMRLATLTSRQWAHFYGCKLLGIPAKRPVYDEDEGDEEDA